MPSFKNTFILLLCLFLVGCSSNRAVNEVVVKIAPVTLSNQLTRHTCKTLVMASAGPNLENQNEIVAKINDSPGDLLINYDTEKLSLITKAAYSADETVWDEWPIVSNTEEHLIASSLDRGTMLTSLSSFILNKKTGAAVWTKSMNGTYLEQGNPDSLITYLQC